MLYDEYASHIYVLFHCKKKKKKTMYTKFRTLDFPVDFFFFSFDVYFTNLLVM